MLTRHVHGNVAWLHSHIVRHLHHTSTPFREYGTVADAFESGYCQSSGRGQSSITKKYQYLGTDVVTMPWCLITSTPPRMLIVLHSACGSTQLGTRKEEIREPRLAELNNPSGLHLPLPSQPPTTTNLTTTRSARYIPTTERAVEQRILPNHANLSL